MLSPAAGDPHAPLDIEWPSVVWAQSRGANHDDERSLSATPQRRRSDNDDDDDGGVAAYWRRATRNIDARSVVLPYVLGLVAALFVAYVAVRVPNAPRKLKHDDL